MSGAVGETGDASTDQHGVIVAGKLSIAAAVAVTALVALVSNGVCPPAVGCTVGLDPVLALFGAFCLGVFGAVLIVGGRNIPD